MKAKRVYDLPTRVFHWLFATLFVVAFTISNTVDDESLVFSYHMIAGLTLCFLVAWRLVWGVIGTTHAHPRTMRRGSSTLSMPRHAGRFVSLTLRY